MIAACCLAPDFDAITDGDQAFIGEKGVTLSGGQKARVALARVCYRCTIDPAVPLVLLDDPLSAVDAHVASALYIQCFAPKTGLLCKTARILVTNHVWASQLADKVVLLAGGAVAFSGTAAEFARSDRPEAVAAISAWQQVKADVDAAIGQAPRGSSMEGTAVSGDAAMASPDEKKEEKKEVKLGDKAGASLMSLEDRQVGSISLRVLRRWAAVAACGWVIQCLAFSMERVTYSSTDWWLSRWASSGDGDGSSTAGAAEAPFGIELKGRDSHFFLKWYASLAAVNAVVVFCRTLMSARNFVVTARSIFAGTLSSVLRAPLSFFETTPHGRITNRFSFDTDILDIGLYLKMSNFLSSLFWGSNALVLLILISPLCAIGLVVALGLFFRICESSTALIFPLFFSLRCPSPGVLGSLKTAAAIAGNWYRHSSRELQRLDAATRSPIQSLFSECLDGVSYIRSFNMTGRFEEEQFRHIDVSNRAIWSFQSANRWLIVRTELLGAAVTAVVGITLWFARDSLDAGYAGLAMVWALNLTVTFGFMVRDGPLQPCRLNVLLIVPLPPQSACNTLPPQGRRPSLG